LNEREAGEGETVMAWRHGYIAVDWGTTNRRAYAIDGAGQVAGSFADDRGLLAVPPDGFEAAAAEIRDRLGDSPMLLAGMVGSNRGWREAPYVPCPATPAALAAAILWIEPDRTGIIPGVSQQGEAGPDVMRGEEVQVLGAVAARLVPARGLVCHPGTHAKWVVTEDGRIDRFRTMMTGELFSLLKEHSILAAQLGAEVGVNAAFLEGAAAGLAGAELLSALFAIRARFVLGAAEPDASSYASGLLIGSDVREGLGLHLEGPVGLVGRSDLCALYAAALALAGHETSHAEGGIAFLAGIRLLTQEL
jgi:2-dehydro-3-deoxygalactonokinase